MEISSSGFYKFESRQLSLGQIINDIVQDSRSNPNLVVYIRADKDCRYDYVAQLLDGCQKYGISRYSLRTDPTPR